MAGYVHINISIYADIKKKKTLAMIKQNDHVKFHK